MERITPAIEMRGISKYFGAVTALEGVGLRLEKGEPVGGVVDRARAY